MGKCFNIIRACPWVNRLADAGLFLYVNLGVACYPCREVGRQGDGLVKGVGVQALGMAQRCSHGFYAGAAHVVERILFGKAPSRCLGMGAQRQ